MNNSNQNHSPYQDFLNQFAEDIAERVYRKLIAGQALRTLEHQPKLDRDPVIEKGKKIAMQEKLILSMADAAQLVSVSVSGIYVLARKEGWPIKKIGKGYTISRQYLDKWIADQFQQKQ
jgi:flavin-dependent dehydrogenase